jgi:hypothetical protein
MVQISKQGRTGGKLPDNLLNSFIEIYSILHNINYRLLQRISGQLAG